MLTSSATTLANAERIVVHYRLNDHRWAGNGTTNGFAAWLFLTGGNLNRDQIAYQMCAYDQACSTATGGVGALNRQLRIDAEGYSGALEEVARARRRLSSFIADLKRSPFGESLWTMIARLATAPDPERLLRDLKECGLHSELEVLFESLRGFESDFPDCSERDYSPGENDHLDCLLRVDIERLDKALVEVPAWLGDVPEVWPEVSALLRLANDADIFRPTPNASVPIGR